MFFNYFLIIMSDLQIRQRLFSTDLIYEKNYLTIPITIPKDSKSTNDELENNNIKQTSLQNFNKVIKIKNFLNSASNYWFKGCKK